MSLYLSMDLRRRLLLEVHGSSGLPSADENQLSDPFCVVEAISKSAQKLFVHRTRVVPKKLCPEWSESFYAVLPRGFECQRIMPFGVCWSALLSA